MDIEKWDSKKVWVIKKKFPVRYIFNDHVKMVKIYTVKFNVAILNRLKIMGFLEIEGKYI